MHQTIETSALRHPEHSGGVTGTWPWNYAFVTLHFSGGDGDSNDLSNWPRFFAALVTPALTERDWVRASKAFITIQHGRDNRKSKLNPF